MSPEHSAYPFYPFYMPVVEVLSETSSPLPAPASWWHENHGDHGSGMLTDYRRIYSQHLVAGAVRTTFNSLKTSLELAQAAYGQKEVALKLELRHPSKEALSAAKAGPDPLDIYLEGTRPEDHWFVFCSSTTEEEVYTYLLHSGVLVAVNMDLNSPDQWAQCTSGWFIER